MPGKHTYMIVVGVIQHDERVLLLRRSTDRRFAPGKWEFVSGYPEARESCEEAMIREVREETGLQGSLIRGGPAYEVDGDGALWVIKPFLVRADAETVTLNAEHTEYRWLRPKEVVSYDAVDDNIKNLEAFGLV